ncbi:MAG: 16S rRNA (guanine(527)-N(7))-methyltransferase RsmG [Negativicutes bacterium]|nr:16S rRNA (guanine(527)-N(7))-methyltransferase RsmG [Negativicutes bacterium]
MDSLADCGENIDLELLSSVLRQWWPDFLPPPGRQLLSDFSAYYRQLCAANRNINLTRIITADGVAIGHFVDSLAGGWFVARLPAGRMIDIGAGAGFPGLPLKMVFPDLKLTVVEAAGKKLQFVGRVAQQLGMDDVELVHARCEDLARDPCHRESYDWVTARAVAGLPVLLEYAAPFLKTDRWLLAWKGPRWQEEWRAGKRAAAVLGMSLTEVKKVDLGKNGAEHHVLQIQKDRPVSPRFPRRAGQAVRQPL